MQFRRLDDAAGPGQRQGEQGGAPRQGAERSARLMLDATALRRLGVEEAPAPGDVFALAARATAGEPQGHGDGRGGVTFALEVTRLTPQNSGRPERDEDEDFFRGVFDGGM
ncbi:hypothetical protein JCM16814_23980 [Desulfobaculum senezii]